MVIFKLFANLYQQVKQGLTGMNIGFFTGLGRFGRHFGHLSKARNIVVGGDTGTGKTAFVDETFILTPIEYLIANPGHKVKLHYLYFSLEISVEEKIAKIVCRHIYKTKNILLDSDYILGKKFDVEGNMIPLKPEHAKLVEDCEDYLNAIEPYITFITGKVTPERFDKILRGYYTRNGRFEEKNDKVFYHPEDKDSILVTVMDTVGLLSIGKHATKKAAIDAYSKYTIYYRNVCDATNIAVSQFNRGIQSTERSKMGLAPQMSDFKDTSDLGEDFNLTIALFSPARYKLNEHDGYSITQLKDRIRFGYILKNRNGPAEIKVAFLFIGEAGMFKELPDPGLMTPALYKKAMAHKHELLKQDPTINLA